LRDLRAPADPHSSPNEKKNFLVLQNPSSNPSKMRETSLPPIPEIFGASSNYRKFLPASGELSLLPAASSRAIDGGGAPARAGDGRSAPARVGVGGDAPARVGDGGGAPARIGDGGGAARVDGGWKCSEFAPVEVEVAEVTPVGSARPDGRKGSAEQVAARRQAQSRRRLLHCGGVRREKEAAGSLGVERTRRQRGRESRWEKNRSGKKMFLADKMGPICIGVVFLVICWSTSPNTLKSSIGPSPLSTYWGRWIGRLPEML
jgi:hypothetical protein